MGQRSLHTNWWKSTLRSLSMITARRRLSTLGLKKHFNAFNRSAKWTLGQSGSRTAWSRTQRSAPEEFLTEVPVVGTLGELLWPRTTICRVGRLLVLSATSLAMSLSGHNVAPISSPSSQKSASEWYWIQWAFLEGKSFHFKKQSFKRWLFPSQVPWVDSGSVQPWPTSVLKTIKIICSWFMLNLNVLVLCCQWNKHSLNSVLSTLSHCSLYPAFITLIKSIFIVKLSVLTAGQKCKVCIFFLTFNKSITNVDIIWWFV